MDLWKKVSFLGLDSQDRLLNKEQILTNRLSFILGVIMFFLGTFHFTYESLRTNGVAGFITLRLFIVGLLCGLNLILASNGNFKLSKFCISFLVPTALITLPVLITVVKNQYVLWHPFLSIFMGIIPVMIFKPEKEKYLREMVVAYLFLTTIFIDIYPIFFENGKSLPSWAVIRDSFIMVKLMHVTGFIFVVGSSYTLKNTNFKFEARLNNALYELQKKTVVVENQSVILKNKNEELQQKQEALKLAHRKIVEANENNYKLLFEQAADGIAILENTGKVQLVNDNLCRMFSLQQHQLTHKTLDRVLGELNWEQLKRIISNLETDEEKTIELSVILNRSKKKIFEVRLHILPDHRIQLFFLDITQRKKASEDLKQREEQLQNLFDNSSDAIIMYDENLKLLTANSKFFKMAELLPSQIDGVDLLSYLKEGIPQSELESRLQMAEAGKTISGEYLVKNKSGDFLLLEIRTTKITYNNQKVFLSSFNDITARKELQRKISIAAISSEENERDRLAKELHDGLGPLLSTAKIYLHSLKSATDKEDFDFAANKIGNIVEDSLTTIREISNNISPHVLKHYGIIHAIEAFIDRLNGAKAIKFEVNSSIKDKRYADVVESTAYRVLKELINNALKYSGASFITINVHQIDNNLLVKYTDNGEGFEEELFPQKQKGFTLINIEHRILSIGGTFSVFSEPGAGIEVDFKFKV